MASSSSSSSPSHGTASVSAASSSMPSVSSASCPRCSLDSFFFDSRSFAALAFKNPSAIGSFCTTGKVPGASTTTLVNLLTKVRRSCPTMLFDEKWSLSKPAVLDGRALIGTDTCNSTAHALICVNLELLDSREHNPVLSAVSLDREVADIYWVHPELALYTAGEGKMHLISIDAHGHLKPHGPLPEIHTQSVREIAFDPACRSQFGSGGSDKTLCFVDLEHGEILHKIPQEDVIGSVRWSEANCGYCPSVTLDKGILMIYDTRQDPVQAAYRGSMGKTELFAHERYSDHNVLLGFGDGTIQHIDVRVTDRILDTFTDPFVEAIGSIECKKEWMVVGGLGPFSVYRGGRGNPEGESCESVVQLWSHARDAPPGDTTTWQPTVIGDGVVFATSSSGMVGIFKHDSSDTLS